MSENSELHEPSESVLEPEPQRPAMIRSEEVLKVGTVTVPYARARMQKVIVTERQTFTVEVRREEVRLVTEPLPAGTPPPPPIASDDQDGVEMVLHEERVIVTTEVVPIERVRLIRHTVTGTENVTGTVRREHIDLLTSGSTIQQDI